MRLSLVMESLWQTPQASIFTRTLPGPGSGMGRSTISMGPLAEVTWATRMDGIFRKMRVERVTTQKTQDGAAVMARFQTGPLAERPLADGKCRNQNVKRGTRVPLRGCPAWLHEVARLMYPKPPVFKPLDCVWGSVKPEAV